jgi:hypothetical protein
MGTPEKNTVTQLEARICELTRQVAELSAELATLKAGDSKGVSVDKVHTASVRDSVESVFKEENWLKLTLEEKITEIENSDLGKDKTFSHLRKFAQVYREADKCFDHEARQRLIDHCFDGDKSLLPLFSDFLNELLDRLVLKRVGQDIFRYNIDKEINFEDPKQIESELADKLECFLAADAFTKRTGAIYYIWIFELRLFHALESALQQKILPEHKRFAESLVEALNVLFGEDGVFSFQEPPNQVPAWRLNEWTLYKRGKFPLPGYCPCKFTDENGVWHTVQTFFQPMLLERNIIICPGTFA